MARKKHINIAALDIDDTICDNSIAEHNVDEFINFLKKYIGDKGSVYIITARRRVEDGKSVRLNTLMSDYVNPKIVRFLREENKDKRMRDWFYFNESEEDLVKYVHRKALKEGILKEIEKYIPKEPDNDPESTRINFYTGVVKMFQIKEILRKEIDKHGPNIKLKFFDDSKYNLRAMKLFVNKLKDPVITKYVHFRGGTGKPVFGGTKVVHINPGGEIIKEELPQYNK